VYGFLQLTSPVGYLGGMVLAFTLGSALGWRSVFYVTGGLGVLLAAVIWLGVREPPRGQAEPELAGLAGLGTYRFSWAAARGLLRKPSLRLMLLQGFFGAFPWNVIAYWFFRYLETERGYSQDAILVTMAAAVLAMSAGYVAGGALGDAAFRRTPRGRVWVAGASTLVGALLLVITLSTAPGQPVLFGAWLCLTAFCMPFASGNVVATVYDVTAPEVRSTAMAVQSFVEETGAALAPLAAGLLAVQSSLQSAILLLCVSAWLLCAAVFALAGRWLPGDVSALRETLRARAAENQPPAGRPGPHPAAGRAATTP
jgi:predicted MFS family arabinose efflux permease